VLGLGSGFRVRVRVRVRVAPSAPGRSKTQETSTLNPLIAAELLTVAGGCGRSLVRLADQKLALQGANLSIAVAKFFVQGLATDPQPVEQGSPSTTMMLSVRFSATPSDASDRRGDNVRSRSRTREHTVTLCRWEGCVCVV